MWTVYYSYRKCQYSPSLHLSLGTSVLTKITSSSWDCVFFDVRGIRLHFTHSQFLYSQKALWPFKVEYLSWHLHLLQYFFEVGASLMSWLDIFLNYGKTFCNWKRRSTAFALTLWSGPGPIVENCAMTLTSSEMLGLHPIALKFRL